jgi:hypothetical protein
VHIRPSAAQNGSHSVKRSHKLLNAVAGAVHAIGVPVAVAFMQQSEPDLALACDLQELAATVAAVVTSVMVKSFACTLF